jgi:polysaccharide export outer membrane protein
MPRTVNFIRFFLLALQFLASCSGPYLAKDAYGADEFVLDSYQIRQGKFSILAIEGVETTDLDPALLEEYQDTIQDGDLLQIVLYHPKRQDLAQAVATVGQTVGYLVVNNQIRLPDLDPIEVGGLTVDQAREAIERRYREEIADVEIFLAYRDRTIRRVELAGISAVPTVPVDGKIRLFEVLSKAKLPPDANLFKSYVLREDRVVPVDLYKLVKQGDMSQNIVMRGGDKVYLAEGSAATLMVMGEVGCECVLSVPHGFMPIRMALAQAHGIPYTGNLSMIQVIRGNVVCPKIYTLSWEHVLRLPNDSLLLIPGDIVFVAPKPITEWNRFISQLLPTFSGAGTMGQSCMSLGIVPP